MNLFTWINNKFYKQKQVVLSPAEQAKQDFIYANQMFNYDKVQEYVETAPYRELFKRVEEIKGSIQRAIDAGVNEISFPTNVVFYGNAELLLNFFNEKGFYTTGNIEPAGKVTKVELTIEW